MADGTAGGVSPNKTQELRTATEALTSLFSATLLEPEQGPPASPSLLLSAQSSGCCWAENGWSHPPPFPALPLSLP